MGRIFNVLVLVIVLSAFFQDGFGFCSSGNSFDTLTRSGGFNGGAAGSGAFVEHAETSGVNGGGSSGTGNGYGVMNTGNIMVNDGSVHGSGYIRGTGNSASSWSTGYSENSAIYGSSSATSNGFYSNLGNGGGISGYPQGGGAYNGDSNSQHGSNVVYGANGGIIQYDSYPNRGFISEVAGDIADTVVDAIKVGHSLMHRPYIRQSYVQHSRPGYVRQVARLPGRVVSVHRGCGH